MSDKNKDTVEQTIKDLGINIPNENENEKNVINSKENKNINFEYYLFCKHQLEILIASGKCKEFIGKNLTYNELDVMKPESVIKKYKVYDAARCARINDSLSETIVKGYSKLCNYVIPIEDENKLYNELKNDYLIMNELNKWVGYLSFQLGGCMTLLSTSVITFSNLKHPNKEISTDKNEISPIINNE